MSDAFVFYCVVGPIIGAMSLLVILAALVGNSRMHEAGAMRGYPYESDGKE
jgi:hypothetical protein